MQKKQVFNFLLITFGISWTASAMSNMFGSGSTANLTASLAWVTYMIGPLIGALVIEKFSRDQKMAVTLKIKLKWSIWYIGAILLGLLIVGGAIGVSFLMPGVEFSPEMEGWFEKMAEVMSAEQLEEVEKAIEQSPIHVAWWYVIAAVLLGPTLYAAFILIQEIGWRGFLFKELAPMGFWNASLLIGLIVGIWQLPSVIQTTNIYDNVWVSAALMVGSSVLLSPILCYLTLKADTLLAPSMAKGVMYGCFVVPPMITYGGGDLFVGVYSLSGFIVVLVVLILLHLYDTLMTEDKLTTKESLANYWESKSDKE